MIDIRNCVYPAPAQMKMVILGARNSFKSRAKSDSDSVIEQDGHHLLMLGPEDNNLLMRLAKASPAEGKFLRMMHLIFDMKAPLYFWKQFDTYKVGTTSNSESTMHSLTKRHLVLEDFSIPVVNDEAIEVWESTLCLLNTLIDAYNYTNDKDTYDQLISFLPNGYMQMRTIDLDYQTLRAIYTQRKGHKLVEWKQFLDWIEKLPYSHLITDSIALDDILKEDNNG